MWWCARTSDTLCNYTLGNISGHNVVVACLPSGVYGKVSASTVVSQMLSTFPEIRFGLMVGIGGGVPSIGVDIRLGDVVISKPMLRSGGVVQYDYGKALRDGKFHKQQYIRPSDDWLFRATYDHPDETQDCSTCEQNQLVARDPRENNTPDFHYGLIASGDQVMKDAKIRDSIAQELDVLCFEMEAAGFMDQLQPLVIRGICDYCDSHKNKKWQGYAALAAAAYAKVFLSGIPGLPIINSTISCFSCQNWYRGHR
ncbi:nucleoside phosphorylase domain-containing protein [Aspergillus varians]